MSVYKFHSIFVSLAVMFGVINTIPVAYAQQTSTNSAINTQTTQDQKIANLKARASQEIDRRITAMNNAITRITNAKRISANDKSALITQIQTQIATLTSLKTKINADTDLATLRTDVQSIVTSYRIFVLFLPKTHILAAADSMLTTADQAATLAAKLQSRITTAQNAGKDVTALTTALTDMQTKIADAKTQANNAIAAVTPLTPDGYPDNKATLQSARGMLLVGRQDLTGARQDAKTIMEGLKALRVTPLVTGTTASPSATAGTK